MSSSIEVPETTEHWSWRPAIRLLLLLIIYCIRLNCLADLKRLLSDNSTHCELIKISNGESRMKRFLFLLLAAGGMMFAASSEVKAQHHHGHGHSYNHGYGHHGQSYGHGYGGYGRRSSGLSISFGRGYGGVSNYGYGYGGYPSRRSYGVSYGYSPRSYTSAYYGGGYYGGNSCGY